MLMFAKARLFGDEVRAAERPAVFGEGRAGKDVLNSRAAGKSLDPLSPRLLRGS